MENFKLQNPTKPQKSCMSAGKPQTAQERYVGTSALDQGFQQQSGRFAFPLSTFYFTGSSAGNNFSNFAFDRTLLGSSSMRALLYASTGKRFLSLAWSSASSSLSFGT
jgi:hypothetical protein